MKKPFFLNLRQYDNRNQDKRSTLQGGHELSKQKLNFKRVFLRTK